MYLIVFQLVEVLLLSESHELSESGGSRSEGAVADAEVAEKLQLTRLYSELAVAEDQKVLVIVGHSKA